MAAVEGATMMMTTVNTLVMPCCSLFPILYMGREKLGSEEFQAVVQALCAEKLT
jgi:hypothetical protein